MFGKIKAAFAAVGRKVKAAFSATKSAATKVVAKIKSVFTRTPQTPETPAAPEAVVAPTPVAATAPPTYSSPSERSAAIAQEIRDILNTPTTPSASTVRKPKPSKKAKLSAKARAKQTRARKRMEVYLEAGRASDWCAMAEENLSSADYDLLMEEHMDTLDRVMKATLEDSGKAKINKWVALRGPNTDAQILFDRMPSAQNLSPAVVQTMTIGFAESVREHALVCLRKPA